MYTSYYLEGVEMKWCQIWLRIEFLIWSHLSSCAVMQGFAQPGTHLLPVCLSVWVSLCLSVHCVWRPQPPIQTSSDKTVGLACQSQTFKMVFGDCREKKRKTVWRSEVVQHHPVAYLFHCTASGFGTLWFTASNSSPGLRSGPGIMTVWENNEEQMHQMLRVQLMREPHPVTEKLGETQLCYTN